MAHGIEEAVVCPGSRNAPIVHNLQLCPDIRCTAVTDERSAGFYALGIALATGRPVAVCVTSGSALLNLSPSVAEAAYRHVPLIIVSADRPTEWIDQLDGQTLPQPNALGVLVRKCVQLPEEPEKHWYCNRLVNEALLAATSRGGGPVHINVPLDEPLFEFSASKLPTERVIRHIPSPSIPLAEVTERLHQAAFPMLVIGQMPYDRGTEQAVGLLARKLLILQEPLSPGQGTVAFDEVLKQETTTLNPPDFVLYLGDTIVSKRLRHYLRNQEETEIWSVCEDGEVHDTMKHQTAVITCNPSILLRQLSENYSGNLCKPAQQWAQALTEAEETVAAEPLTFSADGAVRYFEEQLEDMDYPFQVHYANSTAVRLANRHARHYVWCNRGVNGIEGSLSTASGFSLATRDMVFCIIGDLSFFYDQNALWNRHVGGNLRILLLNNGGGEIFATLPGLSQSPAAKDYIAAAHDTSAQGICTQNDIGYIKATNLEEMQLAIVRLLTAETQRPLLAEIRFT